MVKTIVNIPLNNATVLFKTIPVRASTIILAKITKSTRFYHKFDVTIFLKQALINLIRPVYPLRYI